jgi:alpha-amylase
VRPVTFLFGIHNHQPVGNFDWVIEEAYQKAYKPFLDRLEKHPAMKVALHNSGVLLDWFERHHPEYLERVGALVRAGQVEPITGGYYEPILPSIPEADRAGQIRKMSDWITEHWGREPRGLWLSERVWEPSLAGSLARAGVGYLMVDDAHFLAAGAEPERLWNWWLTEDQGSAVGVWPISKALRYLIPFEPPEKTIDFLRGLAAGGADRVALFADDGEKFGVWPDTFERVYGNGWLDRFFDLIEANADWLKVELPGAVTASRPPAGRIYLPTASYSEMMEWALPTPVQKEFHRLHERLEQAKAPEARFMRGGFWRNFLAKYPESNWMHKRMMAVRERLDAGGIPADVHARALDDVWQAQCNCAYWHGVFGGLYLPHLREGLYRRILSAEATLDAARYGGRPFLRTERVDLDKDGGEEIRVGNALVGLIISPRRGGAIESIDYFPRRRNLSHGMSRRPEAYHEALRAAGEAAAAASAATPANGATTQAAGDSVRSIHDRVAMKEPGLDRQLHYDWYRRLSLLDHVLRDDASFEEFDHADFGEQGDFLVQPWDARIDESETPAGIAAVEVTLRREGTAWLGGRARALVFEKRIRMTADQARVEIEHRITSAERAPVEFRHGLEFNFTMLAGDADDRWITVDGVKPLVQPNLGGRGVHAGVRAVSLHDAWEPLSVHLAWTRPADLWRLPIDTISQSESGFERVYQGTCLLPQWRVVLEPGGEWRQSITLTLDDRA